MRERSTNSREPHSEGRAEECLSRQTRVHEGFGSTGNKPHIAKFVTDGRIASQNSQRTTISQQSLCHFHRARELAAGGALNTWFMTNGLRSFLGTEYGDLILVKIVLFIVMLGFGAANRYWLTPRWLPSNVSTEEDNRFLRLLCASISIEIGLGLIVICVVAVPGQLPPPGHEHHMD